MQGREGRYFCWKRDPSHDEQGLVIDISPYGGWRTWVKTTQDPSNRCDLGFCHNNPNSGMSACTQPTSSPGQSSDVVDGDVATFSTSGGSSSVMEPGCSYSSDPCVCLLRCPVGQSRVGDGSACQGGGQPNCDLGYCHGNPNNPSTYGERCASTTPWFRVDLGALYHIHQIVIHAPSLLSLPKFLVYFGDSPSSPSTSGNQKCGSSYESYMSLTAGQSVTLDCRGIGRYAFLWSGLTSPISVAEFNVLGNIAGGYYYDGFGLSGTVQECPAGSYCQGGSKVPCPPGRYGSSKKNMCPTCDGPCLAGYHCGAGSTGKASEACAPIGAAFPDEFYCLKGLPRQPVPSGHYSLPENENPKHKTGVAVCPDDGSICTKGKRTNNINFGSCQNGKERLVKVSSSELSTWSLDLGFRQNNVTYEFSLYEALLGHDVPAAYDLKDQCTDEIRSFEQVYKSCSHTPDATSGPYRINPNEEENVYYDVICDFGDLYDPALYAASNVGNGPWTIVQRRLDGATDFYRNAGTYAKGFGSGYYTKNFSPTPINNPSAAFDRPRLRVGTDLKVDGDASQAMGSSFAQPAPDCNTLFVKENQKKSGVYWVDGFGTMQPFQVFCDMVTDGGGWTMVANYGGYDGANDFSSGLMCTSADIGAAIDPWPTEQQWSESPIENTAWPGASKGTYTSLALAKAACASNSACEGVSLKFADGGTGGGVTGTYYFWETAGLKTYINWRSWKKIAPERYRVSDEKIQALQGNGGGKFRWSAEPGTSPSCSGGGACNPYIFWKYAEEQPEKPFFSIKSKAHGGSPGNIRWCSSDIDGPYYGGPGETCYDNGQNSGKCGYKTHYGLDTYGTGNIHNGKCGHYFVSCYGGQTYRDGTNTVQKSTLWVRSQITGQSSGFPFTSGTPGQAITWTADPVISGVTSLRLLLQAESNSNPYSINGVPQRPFYKSTAQSLNFVLSSDQYLQRTPSTASNRKTFTMSAWVKLTVDDVKEMDNGNVHPIFAATNPDNDLSDYFGYTQTNGFDFKGGHGTYGSYYTSENADWLRTDVTTIDHYIVQDGGPSSESSDGSCSGQGSNTGPNSDPRQGPDTSGNPQSLCLPATEAGLVGTRCCAPRKALCDWTCQTHTYADAVSRCASQGGRLCTEAEVQAGTVQGTGCHYDYMYVWTSKKCGSSALPTYSKRWYHVVWSVDTTQTKESDRIRFYLNGEEKEKTGGMVLPLNYEYGFNNNKLHHIGRRIETASISKCSWQGLMSQVHFVDGQRLTANSFGQNSIDDDGNTVWLPRFYHGEYGPNGFLLEFADPTNLGQDTSGKNNHFTPNNFDAISSSSDESPTTTVTKWIDVDVGGGTFETLKSIEFGHPDATRNGSNLLTAVADCNSLPIRYTTALKLKQNNMMRLQRPPITGSEGLSTTTKFTLSAYVTIGPDQNVEYHPIFAAYSQESNMMRNNWFGYRGDTKRFGVVFATGTAGNGQWYNVYNNFIPLTSVWYHVVWAVDTEQTLGNDRVKLYVDGTRIACDVPVDVTLASSVITSCSSGGAGSSNRDEGALADCNSAFDANPATMWRYRTGGDQSFFLQLNLDSSVVVAIQSLVVRQSGKSGFSGLNIDVLSNGNWVSDVYVSNKMWGGYNRGAKHTQVDGSFLYSTYSTHTLSSPQKHVTSIRLRFGWADQDGDNCASLHELKIISQTGDSDCVAPPINHEFTFGTSLLSIGKNEWPTSRNQAGGWEGNILDVSFVDGKQLVPSDFVTGVSPLLISPMKSKVPVPYQGEYGKYGFHLVFDSTHPTYEVGFDSSAQNNHFTMYTADGGTAPVLTDDVVSPDSQKFKSGLYYITAHEKFAPFQAYCDMERDGGGWTLIADLGDGSDIGGGSSGSTSVVLTVTESSYVNGWATYSVLPLVQDENGVELTAAQSAALVTSHSGFSPSTGSRGGDCKIVGDAGYCGHDHTYASQYRPKKSPATTYSYTFSKEVHIYAVQIEQHTNGINCIQINVGALDAGTKCIANKHSYHGASAYAENSIHTILGYDISDSSHLLDDSDWELGYYGGVLTNNRFSTSTSQPGHIACNDGDEDIFTRTISFPYLGEFEFEITFDTYSNPLNWLLIGIGIENERQSFTGGYTSGTHTIGMKQTTSTAGGGTQGIVVFDGGASSSGATIGSETVTLVVTETSLSNGWATFQVLPLVRDNGIELTAAQSAALVASHSGFSPSTGIRGGNCKVGGVSYCGHDHIYLTSHKPKKTPATTYTYIFSKKVQIYGVQIEQHTNGINCIQITVGSEDAGTNCVPNVNSYIGNSQWGEHSFSTIKGYTTVDCGAVYGFGSEVASAAVDSSGAQLHKWTFNRGTDGHVSLYKQPKQGGSQTLLWKSLQVFPGKLFFFAGGTGGHGWSASGAKVSGLPGLSSSGTSTQPASGGTSWAMASGICQAKGQTLCSRENVCPNGKLQPPVGGMRGSDVWVATSGASNEWTSIGNYDPPNRLCRTHLDSLGNRPGWGTTSGNYNFRQEVICCGKTLGTALNIPGVSAATPGLMCNSVNVGTAHAPQASPSALRRYRVIDEKIQALQGTGGGKFRWSDEVGLSMPRTCKGSGDCNPYVFWKYNKDQEERPFFSSKTHSHGGTPGNIHWCSSNLEGPWYGAPGETCYNNGQNGDACGFSSHYGLDTYGTGNVHNGKCGHYVISCNGQIRTYLDYEDDPGEAGGTFWVKSDARAIKSGVRLGAIEINGKILRDADKPTTSREFWSGLGLLHALTSSSTSATSPKLKLSMSPKTSASAGVSPTKDLSFSALATANSHAVYNRFKVGDKASGWALNIGLADPTNVNNVPTEFVIGDSLSSSNGANFLTFDSIGSSSSCARSASSGWWYAASCVNTDLNGVFNNNGLLWQSFGGTVSASNTMDITEMAIWDGNPWVGISSSSSAGGETLVVQPAGAEGSIPPSSSGDGYDGPTTTHCPDGTSSVFVDFNSGVDDFGSNKGSLRFTGKQGFVVYFTDDDSTGNHNQADGVEITNQQAGNCHKAGNCNTGQASKSGGYVLGSNNNPGVGNYDLHSSGVVAVFNQGATKVSFMDTDDDGTLKAVFAFDKDGNFIGQSAFASQQDVAIDTSQTTDNRLIYSLEFDTKQGTAGGANDGTVFTIDNFYAEGLCANTQIGENPKAPCRTDCTTDEFVSQCTGSSRGVCASCDPANCPDGYFLTGCGGFGAGSCISDPTLATSDPSAADAKLSCSALAKKAASSSASAASAADCDDHYTADATSGTYTINPGGLGKFEVYCDFDRDDGPWTTFQRRFDGSVDFYRTFSEYKAGFGSTSGEHWLGLNKLVRLTELGDIQLRVDLCNGNGNSEECRYALYETFSIGNDPGEEGRYTLNVDDYVTTGPSSVSPAGDSLTYHNQMSFSTNDRDVDNSPNKCAEQYHGAWWYKTCHYSNLNGKYGSDNYGEGPQWYTWTGHNAGLEKTQMSVSRKSTAKILKSISSLSPAQGKYLDRVSCEAACDNEPQCAGYVWKPADGLKCRMVNSTEATFVSTEHSNDNLKRPATYIKACGKGCGEVIDQCSAATTDSTVYESCQKVPTKTTGEYKINLGGNTAYKVICDFGLNTQLHPGEPNHNINSAECVSIAGFQWLNGIKYGLPSPSEVICCPPGWIRYGDGKFQSSFRILHFVTNTLTLSLLFFVFFFCLFLCLFFRERLQ